MAGLLIDEEPEKKQEKPAEAKKTREEKETTTAQVELPVVVTETPAKEEKSAPSTPPVSQPVEKGSISVPLPVERPEEKQVEEKTTTIPPVLPGEVREAVEELVVEEEEPPSKLVVLVVGEKGTGKTVTAMSFPGEICVLSFDRKAVPIKANFYRGDKRIHVFDIAKYMDWRPERITEASKRVFDVMEAVLKKCGGMGADWIVFDGVELLEQIAEMYMRYRHGLGPIEGIRNLNIWKERKWLLRDLHNKALNSARRGVVYTVYPTWSERIVAGEIVDRRQEPKWLEHILFETDIVLWTRYDESTKRFLVEVQSSKYDHVVPTGHVFDVTGNPFGRQVDWSKIWG